MDILQSLVKDIAKKYEMQGIAQVGLKQDDNKSFFSLGSPSLDFCVYNRIPRGIFIELFGPESSGKTLSASSMCAKFIREEKEKPEEERQHILFVDAEGTFDPDWARLATGYDVNDKDVQTLYITPMGQSAEQIFDMVVNAVQSGKIGLVIFDSLVSIAAQQTISDSFEKKDMGVMAKVMSDFVRRTTGLFRKYKTTFVGINGIIMNIGGYGNSETTPGGQYWRRACSLRLKFKRGDYFDENGAKLSGTAESPAGHIIEMAVLKTKVCRWDRKLGRYHLNYVRGIDVLQDTIDVATMFNIIVNPQGRTYNITDPTTGEYILDENGEPVKIVGEKNIKPYLEEHLDLWKKIYDKVYELMSITDVPNSVSFEKMLGIDDKKLEETFGVNLDAEQE